jgi:hypothetical protein
VIILIGYRGRIIRAWEWERSLRRRCSAITHITRTCTTGCVQGMQRWGVLSSMRCRHNGRRWAWLVQYWWKHRLLCWFKFLQFGLWFFRRTLLWLRFPLRLSSLSEDLSTFVTCKLQTHQCCQLWHFYAKSSDFSQDFYLFIIFLKRWQKRLLWGCLMPFWQRWNWCILPFRWNWQGYHRSYQNDPL